ncbi:MAG: c-type cytochrome [Helicobacteraceae bacterium]|jgi:ubiquinol-cytochrome c reductase cytochrome c1 subunit|nr:c-type cytochrome [Helicobacteraceae bacterium]
MKKEQKILIVLAVIVFIIYLGIEPLAHMAMSPSVEPVDFAMSDLQSNPANESVVKAERDKVLLGIESASAERGRDVFIGNGCGSCHAINDAKVASTTPPEAQRIKTYGLLPPDLSNAAAIYDEVFMIAFIKDPENAALISNHAKAQKIVFDKQRASKGDDENLTLIYEKTLSGFEEKARDPSRVKMTGYGWLEDDQLYDLLAFFRSVSLPLEAITDEDVTINACARCHTVDYRGIVLEGDEEQAGDPERVKQYLGTLPPDLSMIVRSKGEDYLATFINDPQKYLTGTLMPRVGMKKEAQEKVISYLEQVADPKKGERHRLGVYFILFGVILSVLAYFWKRNEFEEIEEVEK